MKKYIFSKFKKDSFFVFLIFLILMTIFNMNFKVITSGDNIAGKVLPILLINSGKLSLDTTLENEFVTRGFSSYLTEKNGKYFVNVPLTGVWETLPLYVPNALIVKIFKIPVSINDARFIALASIQEKLIASFLTSIALVFCFLSLVYIGISQMNAVFSILFFAFTSNIWATDSQGFWTHTIVFFNISVLFFILVRIKNCILKDIMVGILVMFTVFSRPHSLILLTPLLLWGFINKKYDRKFGLLSIVFFCCLYTLFNKILLGSFFGYYSNGSVIYDFGIKKLLNVFISPSKGLFVYQPYLVLLLIIFINRIWSFRLRKWNMIKKEIKNIDNYLFVSIIVFFIFMSLYHYWWGGHSFGPRLMVDLQLFFIILFARYLPEIIKRYRYLLLIFGLWSLILQFSGNFFYPLGFWDDRPIDIDKNVNRVWDLDTQYRRSFRFGPDKPFLLGNVLFLINNNNKYFTDPLIR